jgi:cell division transport system permease protein
MNSAVAQDEPSRMADKPAEADALPRSATPIVPRGTVSGRALVGVVAIMTFLACLTIGAVMLVRSAANEWQAEVAREVTIQIRASAGRDSDADVAKAEAVARGFPGVAAVRSYSKEETAHLLEPWLGSGIRFEELPIPRLVIVRVSAGTIPDLDGLRRVLDEQLPGASLDDHRGFVARMRAMSGAALIGGICVLLLVLFATVLSVTFATRAAMATNHSVIEVLHLIGAKDGFIAAHFQRHFLQLGLKGGLLGGCGAIALFAFADLASSRFAGTAAGDQFTAMFGTFSIGALGYLALIAQIAMVAIVTAATSRHTVARTIETIQ